MKIAVLGSGAWGSTLSVLWAKSGKDVCLWGRKRQSLERLDGGLPASLAVTSNLQVAVEGADILVFAVGSQQVRSVAVALPHLSGRPVMLSVAKGLELNSLKRMSEVLKEVYPELASCALSGPNLAGEIAQGLPAAAVIASEDKAAAGLVQAQLSVATLRLYRSDDLVGVELGGTLKNVIAIAAGCCDGLNLGANAKAALLTRGLAEMTRLAVAMGAQAQTLSGLSGMGDLLATCSSKLSRNYRLGLSLSDGQSVKQAVDSLGGLAEGVAAAQAACRLGRKLNLQLPIAEQVDAVLQGLSTPQQAIMSLMSRPLVSE